MSDRSWMDLWLRDDIQFARLIAELEAAGAFTPAVMSALCASMDLAEDRISELVDRAQARFEASCAALKAGVSPQYQDVTLQGPGGQEMVIHIAPTDEGVVVDIQCGNDEDRRTVASTYAYWAEVEE